MFKQKTHAEFEKQAHKVHDNKYTYLTKYKGALEKIKIKCDNEEHEPFWQRANNHLSGNGCSRCALDAQRKTHAEFEKQAHKVHDNKYTYLTKYKSRNKKIKIKCDNEEHEPFWQRAEAHLRGMGCPHCWEEARRSTTKDFITKGILLYGNKYDYSKTNYVASKTPVSIICTLHKKEFTQTPEGHLREHEGCPECAKLKLGGWSNSAYLEMGLASKNFEELIVYIIKTDLGFYKIGKTFRSMEKRARRFPFEWELVYKEVFCSDQNKLTYNKIATCSKRESELLAKCISPDFILPCDPFKGQHECVPSIDPILDEIEILI